MRVTCPKCGASYALGAEAVPQGGSHVQCGACHTRWFVRAERPVPAALSEDQIVARLDRRGDRPPSAEDAGPAAPARAAPIMFPGPLRPAPVGARPLAPDPEPAAEAAAPAAAPTPLRPRPSAAAIAGRATPEPASSAVPPAAAPRRGRWALGFATALGLVGLGLAGYLRADAAAARAPVAAPALAAYVATVDAGRAWVEARLGPARDRLFGG